MTYLELSKAVKRGDIGLAPTPVPKVETNEDEVNEANLFLEKISASLNTNVLDKIKNYYLRKSLTLSAVEARHLLDAYLLAMPFNLQNFRKFFALIMSKHIVTGSDGIKLLGVVIEFLKREMNFALVESVCEMMEKAVLETELPKSQRFEFMNYLIVVYNAIGAFAKAEKIIALVGEDFSGIDDKTSAEFYWNSGVTYRNQNKSETAALYYKKAFELVKDDHDIFLSYLVYLINKRDYEQAAKICKLSSCGEFTTVAKNLVKCLTGKHSWQELLNSLKDNYSNQSTLIFALDLKCRCLLMLHNFEKAAEIADFIFNLQLKEVRDLKSNFAHAVLKRAITYIDCKDFKGALRFYEEYQQQYPQFYATYLPLRQFSAVIYLANGDVAKAESIIKDIPPTAEVTPLLSQSYLGLALECISPTSGIEDIEKGLRYFELAAKFDPTNSMVPFLHSLALKLKDSLTVAPAQLDGNSNNSQIDDCIEVDLFTEEATEDTEPQYDPKKIHQLFQQQKKQVVATLSSSFTDNFIQKACWLLGGTCIQENRDRVVSLNSQFYPNHFAMIAPGLSLDSTLAEQFNQALQKGPVKRSTTQNGIKFLGGIIELKINQDLRLYTNKIYKNPDGQFLIIFDTLGNHQDIKKQLNRNEPLTIIPVERAPQAKKAVNSGEALSTFVSTNPSNRFFPVVNPIVNPTSSSTQITTQIRDDRGEMSFT